MKRITTLLTIAVLGVGVSCEESHDTGPASPQYQATAEQLVDLLPGSTLAALEVIGLASRHEELRANSRFAQLQDRVLEFVGLGAEDLPEITGDQAVFALISSQSSRRAVPVAVLDPPDRGEALERLAESDAIVAIESRGAIWAGAASQAGVLEEIASGDGTSIRDHVDFDELASRLPPGGMVRGAANPDALHEHLLRMREYKRGRPVEKLAALIAADFEAIDVMGFRRDFVDGTVVTDGWVGIDVDAVPEEIIEALAADRGPALLPPTLPASLVVAKAFRTEPEAGLAWMRFMAELDPDSPFRNLDFWINEFEERTGRDVETDIVDAIGERGVSVVVESDGLFGIDFAVVMEADEPERLEAALVDLRDWVAELIRGRTAGMVNLNGPAFQRVDDHLVIAMSASSMELGVEIAGSADSWTTPQWAEGSPDEIAVIELSAVARLLSDRVDSGHGDHWISELIDLLAGVGDGRIAVVYEDDGFSFNSQVDLNGAVSAAGQR